MSDVDIRVPELRFAGFSDNWKVSKLGDLGDVFTGNTPPTSDPLNWSSNLNGHVWITPTDITGLVTDDSSRRLSDMGWSKARVVPENSVLITSIASIGKNTINKVPAAFNQQINAIVPNGNNAYFILSRMLRDSSRFASIAGQTATAIINKATFEKFEVMVTDYKEQEKIGRFFEQLDKLITLQERKLDLLKKQKQGYLQKMFPKAGERVPELRFAGFSCDWKNSKLGEVVQIIMGQSPSSKNYTNNPNDHILVQGNADMNKGYVVPRVWTTQVTKKISSGAILLSVRAPVGDVGITNYDIVLGRGVSAFKGNNFIFQQLLEMKSRGYWRRYSTGSTFESINSEDIKNASLIFPSMKEQKKIGSFFKQIDENIQLQSKKLDSLKELKKGFLQKMFV